MKNIKMSDKETEHLTNIQHDTIHEVAKKVKKANTINPLDLDHDIKTFRVDQIGLSKRISNALISNNIKTINDLGKALGTRHGMLGTGFSDGSYHAISTALKNLGCNILGPIVINDENITKTRLKELEQIVTNGVDMPKLTLGNGEKSNDAEKLKEYYNLLIIDGHYHLFSAYTQNYINLFRISNIEFIGMISCQDGKTTNWKANKQIEFYHEIYDGGIGKIILKQNDRYFACNCIRGDELFVSFTVNFQECEELGYDEVKWFYDNKILTPEELLKCTKLWKKFKIVDPSIDQAKGLLKGIEVFANDYLQMIIKNHYAEKKSIETCINELQYKGSIESFKNDLRYRIDDLKYYLSNSKESALIEKGYEEGKEFLISQYTDQKYKEKLDEYKSARILHGYDDVPLDETNIKVKGEPISVILEECGFKCETLSQLLDLIVTGKLQNNKKMTKARINVIANGLSHFGVNASTGYRIITPSGELILGEKDVDEHILR